MRTLFLWLCVTGSVWAAKPPNVVFILADDQRADTIGSLGDSQVKTPVLDELAKNGFVFTNAYCQGAMVPAVCAPSRTMLLSGKSLFRIPAPNAKTYDGPTLPTVFNKAGYQTLHVGKKGNGFTVANEQFGKVHYCHDGKTPADVQRDQAKIIADEAIQFLEKRDTNKPFLMYLAPQYPHDPRLAPEEFTKLYDPKKITLSKNFMKEHPFDNGELNVRDEKLAKLPRDQDEMKKHLADYFACISCLDHHVGRVLAELKKQKLDQETIVIFTSDQGLAVGGRHGLMGKQNLYEHFKSPLIISGPKIKPGRSDALVYLFDLLPTLIELTEITDSNKWEGVSLKPIINGEKKEVRDTLFAAYRDCQRMVRDSRYKLMWYPEIDRYQLFDLKEDPDELNDLSAKKESETKLAEMKKLLEKQRQVWGDTKSLPTKKKG